MASAVLLAGTPLSLGPSMLGLGEKKLERRVEWDEGIGWRKPTNGSGDGCCSRLLLAGSRQRTGRAGHRKRRGEGEAEEKERSKLQLLSGQTYRLRLRHNAAVSWPCAWSGLVAVNRQLLDAR